MTSRHDFTNIERFKVLLPKFIIQTARACVTEVSNSRLPNYLEGPKSPADFIADDLAKAKFWTLFESSTTNFRVYFEGIIKLNKV